MSRRLQWAKPALKAISRLDQPTQARILKAIRDLAETEQGDVRRLRGSTGEIYRLRVGGWRILFSYLEDQALLVLKVRARGDAYKG